MRILITAPSLDISKNVSGISMVTHTIMSNADENHSYFHYLLGRPDGSPFWLWPLLLIKQLIYYPFFLFSHKIDVVHQNLPFNAKGVLREYIINILSVWSGCKVLLHIHGGECLMKGVSSQFLNQLVKGMFRRSGCIVVLSAIEKEAILKNYPVDNVSFLSNAINPDYYARKRVRTQERPGLLFMGRIHESKGVDEIIEAIRRLYLQQRNFTFFLCGEGPERERMVKECSAIMHNDFSYEGIVSGEKKLEVMHRSSIFILPSRYGEGLPMSLLECMAMGIVPVVTSDASMKEIINTGENGLKVNKYDADDLAVKLNFLITHPEIRHSMSKNAVSTVRKGYGIKNYMEQLNILYNSLFHER